MDSRKGVPQFRDRPLGDLFFFSYNTIYVYGSHGVHGPAQFFTNFPVVVLAGEQDAGVCLVELSTTTTATRQFLV